MPSILSETFYTAFGLNLKSDIRFHELPTTTLPGDIPDVEIVYGELAEAWHALGPHQYCFKTTVEGVWFAVHGTAVYRISGGCRIVVDPLPGADDMAVKLYLLGTCMGVLLMQRKIVPLHGSAVVINGKAYAFVGESGAGKSTLAAAFIAGGYRMLSDDVIAVSFSASETGGFVPFVVPGYPQQKLHRTSMSQLKMNESDTTPLLRESSKLAVRVGTSYATEPAPLSGIFELVPEDRQGGIVVETPGKLERLSLMNQHTYRNFMLPGLGLTDWHFQQSVKLANILNVYRIRRPLMPFTARELTQLVLQIIQKGDGIV